MPNPEFIALPIAVVTVSDTRDETTDKSGQAILERLERAGHRVVERRIVRDELDELTALFRELVSRPDIDAVIATGGTGITARDVTPDALAPLVDKEIPGFGELFRALSYEEIGAATIQSRAFAAVCERTLVFALPGSTGAVSLAMDKILLSQLDCRTRPCNFAELLPRLKGEARG